MFHNESYILYGGSDSPFLGKQFSFLSYSAISLELNSQTKTLHFFVNDSQLSCCITNIYTTPLSFGISADWTYSSSVEIVSFLLLRRRVLILILNVMSTNGEQVKKT
jgi:hypothetical protein